VILANGLHVVVLFNSTGSLVSYLLFISLALDSSSRRLMYFSANLNSISSDLSSPLRDISSLGQTSPSITSLTC
jgi:hypothetical protein